MRAYLTIAVDIERLDRPALVYVINARNKGGGLCPLLSNSNLLRLARCTGSANVDVVAAGREVDPCIRSQSDVRGARCVISKRFEPLGRVVVTNGVVFQRQKTIRCVVGAGGVAKERFRALGRVIIAGCVLEEYRDPSGHVPGAVRVV